jgi:hypothetical protein
MIRYSTDDAPNKWTRRELLAVAGAVVFLLCIWGVISWKNYSGDETGRLLARTRTQLAEAREKNTSLSSRIEETEKQLADANEKIMALTSVAARAPQLPVYVKQWKDSSVTHAIALQNQSDRDISVHVTVSNPGFNRTRETDCSVPAHKTINTQLKVYPHDTAIVTADGFATRTEKLD